MRHLSLLALGAAVAASPLEAQDRYDWSGALPAGATLRIASGGGDITVMRASGATARVRARVRNADEEDVIRFRLVRDGRDIIICALRTADGSCTAEGIRNDSQGGSRRARADFTVELPAGVVIGASSGNGDVEISGATAAVRASSGNGDIEVGPGAADVFATTGNGSVRVQGARSAVRATSGNGRIEVETARGPVTASSGNGNIQVSIASLPAAGDMSFSSGNGSVTLTLPRDFGAELDASTGSGSIDSDFEVRTTGRITASRLRGTIGRGGRAVRVSTGSGRIRLQRGGE